MSQQINLINTALIKQKNYLTPATIGLAYLGMCACMVGWYVFSMQQVTTLTVQRDKATTELTQLQASLTQATAARAPRASNPVLIEMLKKLEDQQQMQAKVLNIVEQSKAKSGAGLADTMRGFAKQALEGVWLTGFSVDTQGHAMTLRGRSARADLLPIYIDQLGQAAVFTGQSFGGLQIKRPEVKPTPAATSNPANNNAVGAVTTLTASQMQSPEYLEFELQAIKVKPEEVKS